MAKARPVRLEATYAPVSKRACSRSTKIPKHLPGYWNNLLLMT
ncbi:flavodoxin [Lacticaseibacillus paracasei]|nr:flavodoxin [Lacticaseibacillus paracasei]QEM99204.1 flavodoxin [Lacticaseibacillus paracasei]WCZ17766.1 flavodoxin [Lacticaseibacillus paracasei]